MVTAAQKSATDRKAKTPVEVEDANAARQAEAKPKTETLQQLKNRLRNEAEREVLNTHKAEVIKITEAKYDQHGLEYVRRLTDEEKAAKTIEEMYQKFPNLRPKAVRDEEESDSPFGADYEPVTRETVETGPEFDGEDDYREN